MGRAVNEGRITTPNARQKLPPGKTVHWRSLDTGLHLGYRKGTDSGTWVARLRLADGTYVTEAVGRADDNLPADGSAVLSYSEALKRVEQWRTDRLFPETDAPAGPYTVEDAAKDYMVWFTAHRKSASRTQQTIDAHILPTFRSRAVEGLTATEIREWQNSLSTTPARVGGRRPAGIKFRKTDDGLDGERKRKATTNRVLTVLKAILNHAYREGRATADDAWRRVKPFKGADEPRIHYLSEEACVRLVEACSEGFKALVQIALSTGCRYGELAALRGSDFDKTAQTLRVRQSKSGKGRHVTLPDHAIALLMELTKDKEPDDLILLRSDGTKWSQASQFRPLRDACAKAKIIPPISFHTLRHTYGSHLAMKGVSLQVIAKQLGHADTRMTERHYAHLSNSYIASEVRNKLPALGQPSSTEAGV